jgi:hypothetical protein
MQGSTRVTSKPQTTQVPAAAPFTIAAVLQDGRLAYEALLLAASLRHTNPGFAGKLCLMEPQPGPLWPSDPRLADPALRERLQELGAEIVPFDSRAFGASYPHGNKIEGLAALPDGPFLFLDTDTLVTGDLGQLQIDFTRPAASMNREGTWPMIELYGPGYTATWKSLYDRFKLDFAASLDLSKPDEYWQRYLYFNAGWFFHASAHGFGNRFLSYARSIRDNPPPELVCQQLYPWLDQIALPLVVQSFGGGRPGPGLAGLDGEVTCHYHTLPLLYAQEGDRAVEVLEAVAEVKENRRLLRDWPQAKQMIYQNKGRKARALFDRAALPHRSQVVRNTLKREGLWLR